MARPAVRELVGTLRARGLKVTRGNLRITAFRKEAGFTKPLRLVAGSLRSADPKDPSLLQWTAPWTAAESPEGWIVRLEVPRQGKVHSATGPIQVFFLPGAPSDRREERP